MQYRKYYMVIREIQEAHMTVPTCILEKYLFVFSYGIEYRVNKILLL